MTSLAEARARFRGSAPVEMPEPAAPEPAAADSAAPGAAEEPMFSDGRRTLDTEAMRLDRKRRASAAPPRGAPDSSTTPEPMRSGSSTMPAPSHHFKLTTGKDGSPDAVLNFGKYKGQAVSDMARDSAGYGYLVWMTGQDFPSALMEVVKQHTAKRGRR